MSLFNRLIKFVAGRGGGNDFRGYNKEKENGQPFMQGAISKVVFMQGAIPKVVPMLITYVAVRALGALPPERPWRSFWKAGGPMHVAIS